MGEKSFKELKKNYEVFRRKYDLPEFFKLNERFDIEDVAECETEFLLRKIRKIISEKIAGYLRFFEVILNPSNAPMFFFNLIKKLSEEDRNKLGKIYERLGNLEIELIRLDLQYSEEKEAEFIKNIYSVFNEISKDVLKVINKMVNGIDNEKKEKGSYFG